jgi:hypothetical protein
MNLNYTYIASEKETSRQPKDWRAIFCHEMAILTSKMDARPLKHLDSIMYNITIDIIIDMAWKHTKYYLVKLPICNHVEHHSQSKPFTI